MQSIASSFVLIIVLLLTSHNIEVRENSILEEQHTDVDFFEQSNTPDEILYEINGEMQVLIRENVIPTMKFEPNEVYYGGRTETKESDNWQIITYKNDEFMDIFIKYQSIVPLKKGMHKLIYYLDTSCASVIPDKRINRIFIEEKMNTWKEIGVASYSGVRMNGYENILPDISNNLFLKNYMFCTYYRMEIDKQNGISEKTLKFYVEHEYIKPGNSYIIFVLMTIAFMIFIFIVIRINNKNIRVHS